MRVKKHHQEMKHRNYRKKGYFEDNICRGNRGCVAVFIYCYDKS